MQNKFKLQISIVGGFHFLTLRYMMILYETNLDMCYNSTLHKNFVYIMYYQEIRSSHNRIL